jgi:hypothetical protein
MLKTDVFSARKKNSDHILSEFLIQVRFALTDQINYIQCHERIKKIEKKLVGNKFQIKRVDPKKFGSYWCM